MYGFGKMPVLIDIVLLCLFLTRCLCALKLFTFNVVRRCRHWNGLRYSACTAGEKGISNMWLYTIRTRHLFTILRKMTTCEALSMLEGEFDCWPSELSWKKP